MVERFIGVPLTAHIVIRAGTIRALRAEGEGVLLSCTATTVIYCQQQPHEGKTEGF